MDSFLFERSLTVSILEWDVIWLYQYFVWRTTGVHTGPITFSKIYINDIVDNIASEIYLFADDTSLINIDNNWLSVEKMLNDDLRKLSIWSKNWLLTFNALKTEYMQISNKRSSVEPITLKLNGQLLSSVKTHKHLGLMLNENFSWSDHIDCVCKRVNMRLAVLRKLRCSLNRSCLLKLYCSCMGMTSD